MPSTGQDQHEFASVDDLAPIALMDGIRVRAVDGERITLAVFELEPGMRMPEHRHPNEQVGVVLRGEFTFSVGGETRLRRTGDMWVIPAEVPSSCWAAYTAAESAKLCASFLVIYIRPRSITSPTMPNSTTAQTAQATRTNPFSPELALRSTRLLVDIDLFI